MESGLILKLLQNLGMMGGIIAIFWIIGLNKRLTKLENDLEKLKQ